MSQFVCVRPEEVKEYELRWRNVSEMEDEEGVDQLQAPLTNDDISMIR
jgi:hypothetical protein